jgi:FixJ family two-component response regulator
MLELAGYRVDPYPSASGVLSRWIVDPPDLACLDVLLPELAGDKMLGMIRAMRLNFPVIFVTGMIELKSDDVGVQVVEKPFEQDVLLDAVRAAIGEP